MYLLASLKGGLVLLRRLHVDAPDRFWVTDITYNKTREGFLYLGSSPVGGEIVSSHERFDFLDTIILPRWCGMVKIYSLCMALETAARTDGYHTLIRGLGTA